MMAGREPSCLCTNFDFDSKCRGGDGRVTARHFTGHHLGKRLESRLPMASESPDPAEVEQTASGLRVVAGAPR